MMSQCDVRGVVVRGIGGARGLVMGVALCATVLSGCFKDEPEETLLQAATDIECVYSSDCPDGLVCNGFSGRCDYCVTDAQCGASERCTPEGTCASECQNSRDCSVGPCVDGVCIAEGGSNETPILPGVPAPDTSNLPDALRDFLAENGFLDEDGDLTIPELPPNENATGGDTADDDDADDDDAADDDDDASGGDDDEDTGELPDRCANANDLNQIPGGICGIVTCYYCRCYGEDSRRCQSLAELDSSDEDDAEVCRKTANALPDECLPFTDDPSDDDDDNGGDTGFPGFPGFPGRN